ncbi:hypothetical protein ACLB2K_035587 [Fragaria x ananassa]
MEPLIRQLDKLARNSKAQVSLLSSPFGFRVSNLMFADDCLIFAKATKKAAGNINTVLNAFAAASGQKINLHKSSLYFSDKVPAGTRNNIVNVINIQQKSSIGKYLGINNVMFWKDPINAKDLMQKLSKRLAGWKQNTLSRAGKLTLIKSNVAGMPNHVMACFKCSKKLTDEIDKQERNFLWGTDMKQAPVAWKDICKPKALGGLGIRPSAFFNNAALAKLAWKIITDKNNWWVQVITQKYLRKCSFFQAKKKQKNSYAWNGILDTRELVLKDGWNITKLREHFTHEVVREIMGIPIPTTPLEDEFIWGPASHGRWTPPPPLWVKINFDGSVRSGAAAGGFIIRTDSGNPILAAAFNCGRANVPVTEAMALRNSLIQAQELGVTNVFSYVLREANFVANALANLGHSTSTICMWEGCVPPEAAMALSFDIVNVGCSRGTSL